MTAYGRTIKEVLNVMSEWGARHRQRIGPGQGPDTEEASAPKQ